MGKKRIRIVNAEIEPQPQDPSHGSLGPNQSQDTLPLDQSLGPSANRSSALLVPQPQADDNSDEESTNIEVQITGIMKLNKHVLLIVVIFPKKILIKRMLLLLITFFVFCFFGFLFLYK